LCFNHIKTKKKCYKKGGIVLGRKESYEREKAGEEVIQN